MEVKLKKGNEVKLMKWAQLVDGMKWNQTSSGMNQINGMEGLHAQVEAQLIDQREINGAFAVAQPLIKWKSWLGAGRHAPFRSFFKKNSIYL